MKTTLLRKLLTKYTKKSITIRSNVKNITSSFITQPPPTISSCPFFTKFVKASLLLSEESLHHLSKYDISSHINLRRGSCKTKVRKKYWMIIEILYKLEVEAWVM